MKCEVKYSRELYKQTRCGVLLFVSDTCDFWVDNLAQIMVPRPVAQASRAPSSSAVAICWPGPVCSRRPFCCS